MTASVAHGRSLLASGAVTDLELGGAGALYARVRSSSGRGEYSVYGSIESGLLHCNCSWKGSCKHVAAALLLVRASSGRGPDLAPSPDLPTIDAEAWLARLGGPTPLPSDERVAFRLERSGGLVSLAIQRRTKAGSWSSPQRMPSGRAHQIIDGAIGEASLVDVIQSIPWDDRGEVRLNGARGGYALDRLIDTERLILVGPETVHLKRGEPIAGALAWRTEGHMQVPHISLGGPLLGLLPLVPLHYIDAERGWVGRVEIEGDPSLPMRWLSAPRVLVSQTESFCRALAAVAPTAPLPQTHRVEIVREPPRARLRLRSLPSVMAGADDIRFAELSFRYGDIDIPVGDFSENTIATRGDRTFSVERSRVGEEEARDALRDLGLSLMHVHFGKLAERWTFPSLAEWLLFLCDRAEALRERGFDVEVDPSFRLEILDSSDWFTDLESSETDWFDLDLGIRVDGQRLSLLPLIVEALGRDDVPPQGFFLELPDGRFVRVPAERIVPLADLILELAATPARERVYRLSRLRSMDLAAILKDETATLSGLRRLRGDLTAIAQLPKVALPKAFRGKLRPYQAQGVAWLDVLGRAGLGAVVADDMGLGKTVQLIAFMCVLRQRERGPSLIVAPTSVLLSWSHQLEQFAPHLTVAVWHGAGRHDLLEKLGAHDVVLTSYALLRRDADDLGAIDWNLCILDEAQTIKNAKTVFAEKARLLRARQRIALTGTPVENHLGELWSIVSYAVPGALGSERAFRGAYRTPIEKHGDVQRLDGLRRRLAPILLRRTKDEVASDLPSKTFIEHAIELDDPQRDLYETIRATVEKRVRDAIAKRGLAGSQIILLDALLKLRQVCCDPRLLKAQSLKRGVSSAKLQVFEDLVATLVSEGRRILVFSQFVEMLELLASALDRLQVQHTMLTGATRDRARVVDQFRTGAASVFLISLKAGGTGLNLVEADTVIHYDPWWNPAVEAQATDRAHRIGQTRPVFVHRLIARGTVEEKIVALQAKKAELARGLLEGASALKLDADAVDELLAPMPGNEARHRR